MKKHVFVLMSCFILVIIIFGNNAVAQESIPSVNPGIWVRPGYKLTVAVKSDLSCRHMALGPDGTLYYTTNPHKVIMAAKDKNHDGYYETLTVFYKSENGVSDVAWYDGYLWYTESGAVYKLKDKNHDGIADERDTVLAPGTLPKNGAHHYRPVLILNGRLYTALGDKENFSDPKGTDREKIWSYNLEGKDKKLYCSGIRNTEKLVIRPGTDEIWGMDVGSDWFGKPVGDNAEMQPITDNNPPGEMNKYIQGGFYGQPFIVGNKLPRYEYLKKPDIIQLAQESISPEWCTHAHWSPLGMMFYTGNQFPENIKGDAFVAYHGSWNSSHLVGYQVTCVLFENGKPYGELPYVKFLNKDQSFLGRPVDVIQAPDGSLLISDDANLEVDGHTVNYIYRLTFTGNK